MPVDGWGNKYSFTLNPDLSAKNVMAIFSPGRDGIYETEPAGDTAYQVEGFDIGPDYYDRDIIWADGYFVQWPAPGCRR